MHSDADKYNKLVRLYKIGWVCVCVCVCVFNIESGIPLIFPRAIPHINPGPEARHTTGRS